MRRTADTVMVVYGLGLDVVHNQVIGHAEQGMDAVYVQHMADGMKAESPQGPSLADVLHRFSLCAHVCQFTGAVQFS